MEANKQLAEKWKTLSARDRASYIKKAQDDKVRYDKEMENYEPTADSMLRSTKSGTRLQKDPKRPKKPKTAYLCFADQHREALAKENPGAGVSVLSKKIAEKWKNASAAEKANFEKIAETDRERFTDAMKSYEPSAAYLAAKEKFKERKKAGKDGVPPPPALLTVDAVEDESLVEQNKALKEQLAAQAKQLAEQTKLIEKLQKSADKEGRKRPAATPAEEAPAKKVAKTPPPAKAPKAAKEPATAEAPTDEKHFMVWVQSKLGAGGEKASPAMKKVNEAKGADGLAEFLRKQYMQEMKKAEKPAAAPKPAAKAEPPAKRAKRS